MKITKRLFVLMTVLFFALPSTNVQAEEYEEVTYDDLVHQIGKRKTQISASHSRTSFDSLMIHAGIGLVNTATNINYAGSNSVKYQNGFQLSLGIDLFSPNWATEGVLRNFGQVTSGTETRSLREFDLKVFYRDATSEKTGYRLGAGIGTRYFRLSDPQGAKSIEDSTPTSLLIAGIDFYASKNVSVGLEGGMRSAMVTETSDKNSLDTTLRFDIYF